MIFLCFTPDMILEFLHTQTRFKSVKLGCGEGIYDRIVITNTHTHLHFTSLFASCICLKIEKEIWKWRI